MVRNPAEKLAQQVAKISSGLGYLENRGRKLRKKQVIFVANQDPDILSESILHLPIIFSEDYGVEAVSRYQPVWPVVLFSSVLSADPKKLLVNMMVDDLLLGLEEDGLPMAIFSDLSRETCFPYAGFAGTEGGKNFFDILSHDWSDNGKDSWTPAWLVAEYFYHDLISRYGKDGWPLDKRRVHFVK
ncbi:hypothetical protein KBD75_01985 [Candidatus Woesebacteria bacterium]|nr:hypothetical protein [Candidatus Woesebacteria bacterium]